MRKRTILAAILGILAGLLALATWPAGCVGAPRDAQQLADMPEPQFAAWLQRVNAWSVVLTDEALKQYPATRNELVSLASALGVLSGSPEIGPGALTATAEQIGISSSVLSLLVLELQAQLDSAGGLPGGDRGRDILASISEGMLAALGV